MKRPQTSGASSLRQSRNGRSKPALVCMASVPCKPINWLWPQRVAAGRITLLVGMPGAGKSFLTCDMAARVSTGQPWPDGSACPAGSVILVTAEDDPSDTIRPRLDAHNADLSRVHLLSMVRRFGANGEVMNTLFTLTDIAHLEDALRQVRDCKLIVIDPVGSFLGRGVDAHRDNEVRSVLAPVGNLAERYGATVLVVAHRRKSAGSFADDTALGSRAFTGIARAVWHLSRDRANKDRRLLLPGKNNLAAEQQGLAFSIAGEPGAVQWEAKPVAMSADDALAQEHEVDGQLSAVDEAVAWLTEELADGPRPGGELKRAAERDGIRLRTLERARAKLGVIAKPESFRGRWVWSLPEPTDLSIRQESEEFAKPETLAKCEEAGGVCGGNHEWIDEPVGDGRIRTSCRGCGKFRGYRTEN